MTALIRFYVIHYNGKGACEICNVNSNKILVFLFKWGSRSYFQGFRHRCVIQIYRTYHIKGPCVVP